MSAGVWLVAVAMAVAAAPALADEAGGRSLSLPNPVEAQAAGGKARGAAAKQYAGRMVEIPSGDERLQAYLATPTRPARGAIVVVQEWWGLNDWVKKVANRFAGEGYVAIAPDLYRGQVATGPDLAHELSRGLPQERALRDIRAAATYVEGLPEGRARRTGVIGFCMGGGLALRASLDGSPFEATVMCYGSPVTEPERLKTLSGPLLAIFGAADRGIGPEQAQKLERALDEADREGKVLSYEGAGHAFLNEGRSSYHAESARKAWDEIDRFFAKHVAAR